jgi:RNA polymerase sigma factor (sigma-70 family)
MDQLEDSALLRRYVQHQSDDAFAALVTRHINLVYSVALRQGGSPENAEEITQAVFIILAKKAAGLRHDKALSSWLFQTSRLTAANFVRSESRRRNREQEAHMQSILDEPQDAVWPKLAPLLDSAVANLREKDREAILLRFYEGKNLRDVGVALGASEAAAEKRVSRALERLREFFSKRGVDSTAAMISGALSTYCVQTAPAAFAKSATAAAIAKGGLASGPILTLVKGTLKVMAWTKVKMSVAVGATVLLAAGTTALLCRQAAVASIDGTFRSVLFKHRYTLYAQRFEGVWEGDMAIMLNSSGRTWHRRVVVKIVQMDGSYRAIIDEIDLGLKNVLAPQLTMDKLSVNFSSDSFSYHGVFHKDATEIRGVWRSQHFGDYLLVLTRTNTPDVIPPLLTKDEYTHRPYSTMQGLWKGVLTNSPERRVYLKISETGVGVLRGEWDSIDTPPVSPFPVFGLNYISSQFHFVVPGAGGTFGGDVSEDYKTLSGEWKQVAPFTGTKTRKLILTRVDPDDEDRELQAGKNFDYTSDTELQGHWSGTFPPTLGVALDLALNVAKLPDGSLSATVDSPDQMLSGIPCDVVEFKPPKVRLELKDAHWSFEGKLLNGKLSGAWNLEGDSEPVTFERKKP